MEFIGRIAKILPERTGISQKTGNQWRALPFVFEYFESDDQRYSDKVLLETFDTAVIDRLKMYDRVRVGFAPRVREYEGRHYNDIHLYKLEILDDAPKSAPEGSNDSGAVNNPPETEKKPQSAPQSATEQPSDDLPF